LKQKISLSGLNFACVGYFLGNKSILCNKNVYCALIYIKRNSSHEM
jgi:hypothetical protein